jgi:hypothetical protein
MSAHSGESRVLWVRYAAVRQEASFDSTPTSVTMEKLDRRDETFPVRSFAPD